MTRQRPRGRRPASRPVQPVSMPQKKATILLTLLCALVWEVAWGLLLFNIQKLPPLIVSIVSGVQAVIAFLILVFGGLNSKNVTSFFKNIWGNAHKFFAILLGFSVATMLVLPFILFYQPPIQSGSDGILPAPVATMKIANWHPLFKQTAPNCNNPPGTTWYVHKQGTYLSCNGSYTLMQRISSNFYADMELIQVNSNVYSQIVFRVQVQVTFQNPTDTGTQAALLVQTPAQLTAVGGYLFTLNSEGQWKLQDVIAGTTIPTMRSGQVTINPSKPITMTVYVKNGLLVGEINGQSVVEYNDNLNPLPGQVGLLVQGPVPSSPILYSNFELAV